MDFQHHPAIHTHGTSMMIVAHMPSATHLDIPALTFLPTTTIENEPSQAGWFAKRSNASCTGKSADSAECETPVQTNYLAIGLGVAIPLGAALIAIIYLHFRNVKMVKKEEEADKDIDLDNDQDDFAPQVIPIPPHQRQLGMSEKNISTTSISTADTRELQHDPFQVPYQIPQLASSQTSLNNYDPYDLSAYPPTGPMYQSPKYPGSVITRSSSPGSIISNPYSDSHQVYYTGQNPSQQALNPSSTSLNGPPRALHIDTTTVPPRSVARVNSVISSRTPVETTHTPPMPTHGSVDIDHDHDNNKTFNYSAGSTRNVVNIPNDDDDEARHQRIEKSLDTEIHELESIASRTTYNYDTQPTSENSEPSQQLSQGNLQRTQTKGGSDFERVKSFYKEYFPKDSPDGQDEKNSQQHFHEEHDSNRQHDNRNAEDYQYDHHSNTQYDQQHAHSMEHTQSLPHDQEGDYYNANSRQQDYYNQETPHPAQSQHEAYQAEEMYNASADHSYEQYVPPPVPPSQQSVRPSRPLTVLADLPTPHKLGEELGSTIKYAPQRRNGAPSPGVAVFNPLNSPITFDDKPLASPSQMRDSVSMAANFVAPKKFTRNRSNSLAEQDELGSLRSGVSRAGQHGQRPPSELVPAANSALHLKPTMNMGYSD